MDTLTPDQQRVLTSFADGVLALDSTGQGVAVAAIEDARWRRAAGITADDYANLVELRTRLEQVGATLQGLVIGGVHAIRELRVKTTV